MTNKNFKQKIFTINELKDGTEVFSKIFDDMNNLTIYKLIINAPAGTWLYINEDISPIIINES